MKQSSGPLQGIKILEFAGMGPAPFCGMLLSDLGADVIRIDRPNARYDKYTIESRGRRSVELDLKTEAGIKTALKLASKADALIEGFRPGVMERLGLASDIIHQLNPGLVYGRMTGWGQTGPYAEKAGHDINYIAISGALHAMGSSEQPSLPLNLVGDYGGGALYLAFGLLAALLHVEKTGEGQVIDCAMSDGTIGLMSMLYGHLARGTWLDQRESNIIDGAAHFYNTYKCSDGEFVAFGSIEPQFYAELLKNAGISDDDFSLQMEKSQWPSLKAKLAKIIATKTRAEWDSIFEKCDACYAPVLAMKDAPLHPHNMARNAFVEIDGVQQPAPSPRFSKTPGKIQHGTIVSDEGIGEVMKNWGLE